jgi:hypothetical protein
MTIWVLLVSISLCFFWGGYAFAVLSISKLNAPHSCSDPECCDCQEIRELNDLYDR